MPDLGDASFDPALWSLVSQEEGYCHDVDETSSSIGAESEGALDAEARRLESSCCQNTSRVTFSNRERLEELLQFALSVDF